MIGTSLTDPLGGLTAQQWDEIAGPHFYSTSAWLRYCARDATGRTGALVAGKAGGQVCAVPVSEIVAAPPALYRWSDLLEKNGLPRLPDTGLMLGILQGYQTHLLSPPGGDAVTVAETLAAEALRLRDSLGKPGDMACVGMYLTTADVLAARTAGIRALPVLLEADAWIDIPEGGWEAWLGTLPRKRGVAVRREVRRFEEAGYQVSHRPLSECYPDLVAAAMATNSKYGQNEDADFYEGLLKAHVTGMGEAARVAVCAKADGVPIGFCLYYEWRNTVFLRWAGFDYKRTSGAAEYFNLVYYTQIARAAESGLRGIHAGIKATEAKALRGATLHPLWLLDLDNAGPLARSASLVREHNRRLAAAFLEDARTAPAIVDRDAWTAFT